MTIYSDTSEEWIALTTMQLAATELEPSVCQLVSCARENNDI